MPLAALPDVETDFVTKLNAIDASFIISGATQDTWPGPMRPTSQVPMNAVFVKASGGTYDLHNDGITHKLRVQVTVRSARDAYAAGEARARTIAAKMSLLGEFTVNGNRYVDCKPIFGMFEHLEMDDDDCHIFFGEFELTFEQLFT